MKKEVSVITITYNCQQTIEKTILSVIGQKDIDFEYIIIDGASTDGTLDIIHKYRDKIDVVVSEPDKGIYNAMNKGIEKAHGDWINFMNAGDTFFDDKTMYQVFNREISAEIECLYGDYNLCYKDITYHKPAEEPNTIYKRISFCHQASFLRNSGHHFDESYQVCADYAMFRKIIEEKGESAFLKIELTVANYDGYGLSSNLNRLRRKENIRITSTYNKRLGVLRSIRFFFAKLMGRI